MIYLFINTSTANLIVSIIKENKIVYFFNKPAHSNLSIDLLPIIKEGMNEVNITPKDINKIFVTNGPGSFTGIRIGLAVVKTMSYALKIPVISISSLEIMASEKKSLALIDARRGYVYAGAYDDELNNIFEDQYILLKDLNLSLDKVSYDFDMKEPFIDILKIIKKHQNDIPINPHELNPKYLKLTEAEERLNDTRNNS